MNFILTGCIDTHLSILYYLDVKSLNRFCQTNSTIKQHCQESFWIQKMKHDDLSYLIPKRFNNPLFLDLNTFVHQKIKIPTAFNQWLTLYNTLIQSKKNAQYTLIMYAVELQSSENVIYIFSSIYFILLILNAFSYFVVHKIYKENNIKDISNIYIRISDHKDNVYIYNVDIFVNDQILLKYNSIKKSVLNMLSYAYYLKTTFNSVGILDKHRVPYIYQTPISNKRYGMLELLKYQELQNK
jgi:hypothetical protein